MYYERVGDVREREEKGERKRREEATTKRKKIAGYNIRSGGGNDKREKHGTGLVRVGEVVRSRGKEVYPRCECTSFICR